MNEIFKTKQKIELDANYFLEPDQFKGIVLVFNERREREKTIKENGKKVKTGEKENYLFEDRWYFPKLSMVLNKYLTLKQCEAKTIEQLYDKILGVENVIEQFKN